MPKKNTAEAVAPAAPTKRTPEEKEQRKADWAIIKDMVRYLWPKDDFGTRFRVSLSVALLVGAKVVTFLRHANLPPHSRVDLRVGPQCSSPFLLQVHCRFHECRFCRRRWNCCHCRWCNYLCL